jgi:SAM-dependent methyltransferase
MYSISWFETFVGMVPSTTTDSEVDRIASLVPPREYPRILDVGCGVGRTVIPLIDRGYQVTGLDTNVEALQVAIRSAPGASYVALDQRDVGQLRWRFDAAIILWNSFGFGSRSDDITTLAGLRRVLRPGGRLLMDLYHPEWLGSNPRAEFIDERGASITRYVRDGRCFHAICYPDGVVDDIQFNVYGPEEMDRLLRSAGFEPQSYLVWWNDEHPPGPDHARYQVVCTR